MENVTPLQLKAQQLREDYKRAEVEKLQIKLAIERKELINKFSSSFSSLYSLLIGSNVRVEAEVSSVPPVILLSLNGNKATIGFEQSSGNVISWNLLSKSYNATLPTKELGVRANSEDEDRLIIAIEELLFAPPVKKEQETETVSLSYSTDKR